MAAGLGAVSAVAGSWLSAWLPLPRHSPFVATVFVGWAENAWLWLVFAPIALVVARLFPVKPTSFVWVGGVSGFFFWFALNTALFGVERFWELPLYALSCLFWFIAGLFWAMGFARRGAYLFRKAQENAEAISKPSELWVAASANTSTGEADTPAAASATQASSDETHAAEDRPFQS
jgi:hypothetical protein